MYPTIADPSIGVRIVDPKGVILRELREALRRGDKVFMVGGRSVDVQGLKDMILRLRKGGG